MEKPCIPVLRKIKADDHIKIITPLVDAQFLIGKSWDVSFKLSSPGILEKHCTIEKIDANKWTILSHNDVSTMLNGEFLSRGLPRILKCGDRIGLTSDIQFYFECSSTNRQCCNGTQERRMDDEESDEQMENQPLAINENLEQLYNSTVDNFSYMNLKLHYKQLLSQNTELIERLRNVAGSVVYWKNEKVESDPCYSLKINSYNDLMEKYSHLFKLKGKLEKHRNSHVKLLDGIVTAQFTTIERLQEQLNRLHEDFESTENDKNNLEGTNQHLNNENVALRTKIAQYIENAKYLNKENLDLQQEIAKLQTNAVDLQSELAELKIKRQELEQTLNNRIKEIKRGVCSLGDQNQSLKEINQNCETVLEVKSKLTGLLESEFKCTICDEVFVEALVTNCGHTFCEYCIKSWKVIKPNCPICRSVLTRETKALTIDSYLTNIMPFASDELRSNWLKVVDERKQKVTSRKRKYSASNCVNSSSSQNSEVTINFEYALLHVYERLMHYSDVDNHDSNLIDLTNDGMD